MYILNIGWNKDITNKDGEGTSGPSSNLRKRKSDTKPAIKEEAVEPPSKKLSKSGSQSSKAKRKNDEDKDDSSVEIKVENGKSNGKKKVRNEEEDENKPASKSRGRKKAVKNEKDTVEDEEEDEIQVKIEEENGKHGVSYVWKCHICLIKCNKVKVVAFSGEVPVDEIFIQTVGEEYRIYKEGELIYDCMLNQVKWFGWFGWGFGFDF